MRVLDCIVGDVVGKNCCKNNGGEDEETGNTHRVIGIEVECDQDVVDDDHGHGNTHWRSW